MVRRNDNITCYQLWKTKKIYQELFKATQKKNERKKTVVVLIESKIE